MLEGNGMQHAFSEQSLRGLFGFYKDDSKAVDMILLSLKSFEDYHAAIFSAEIKRMAKGSHQQGLEDYQDEMQAADKSRTLCHNSVLSNVNVLNRMAVKAGLPPVYEGTVSESQPYRREVADAVLAYVEGVVKERG
ncbi:MAG: DUF3232 domain-containing protein [Clostridiales bacterium]|nr:DUF3232 domain-containing protein [Clostridiales bacterium]